MIEHDALLFPDTGPEFLRTLRSTAFYSERVRSLTFLNYGVSEALSTALRQPVRSLSSEPPLIARVRQYFKFIADAYDELDLFNSAGVWEPLQIKAPSEGAIGTDQIDTQWRSALDAWGVALAENRSRADGSTSAMEVTRLLNRAFEDCPPSYGDLVLINRALESFIGKDPNLMEFFGRSETPLRVGYIGYLLTLSLFAEHQALTPVSWSPTHLDALANARGLLPKRGQNLTDSPVFRRASAELRLGRVAVERHIPRVDDLPTAELLEIRCRRLAELEALRVGVRSLATQVDTSKSAAEVELQTQDLVARHVDPAVRDLDVALKSARRDVISKLGSSWKSGPGALLTLAMSCFAGAPPALAATMTTAVAFALPFIESELQRRRLASESQWSILWRLSQEKS